MRSLLVLLALSLPATAEVGAERAGKLEHMVIQDCGSCHGLTMKGGLGSPLTPEALAHAEADGLALIILDGVPGTAMPRWRPVLSEEDALWIANYLKEGAK
ncbi:c-type cytochrome [Albidovulum sp.]|uniref:c-type cytochrome n=1 Tax=Albidovulum sp. TaxID=1872424 RepID=UPI001D8EB1D5|nr:cytochrome c [Paracoccaceae bacterium]HPE24772.1 cytochrome c [Albidovulum sp.]MCB2119139.1 cytochrome c [Paracoccaceae bacterium]MCB2121434.1 cytochrome c [Paracoccaceae bacterium]MCB2133274.1 cytochrome c [Paracoccaceae bacterium]